MAESTFRCGYIGLVGRPNVGKSTLLNRMVGQKISITSRKPQTTRHRILGIHTTDSAQMIFVDTPGLHRAEKNRMNRYMNRAALTTIQDVDLILFMIDAGKWTAEDETVLDYLRHSGRPVILIINKVDRSKDKSQLLPFISEVSGKYEFVEVIPISARKGDNLDTLEAAVTRMLPVSPPIYDPDQVTDRSMRFIAAESIREKLMRGLGQELPYQLTVEIERYREEKGRIHINAVVWVERENQKGIVIGRQGSRLKEAGTQARKELENITGKKVNLELWVKVRSGWLDDERSLRSLGYADDEF